jgi:hypothetical protein
MYLTTYDKVLDAASLYLNFMTAMFNSPAYSYPRFIDLTSSGDIFTISATHYDINLEGTKWHQLADIFDIENHQQSLMPAAYSPFEFLRPIVWFAEYCVVHMTTAAGTERQVFMRGSPSAPATQLPPSDEFPPGIGFCFTLPTEIFGRTTLDFASLKQAVSVWMTRDFVKLTANNKTPPQLGFNWCEQSEYHHSLHIDVS